MEKFNLWWHLYIDEIKGVSKVILIAITILFIIKSPSYFRNLYAKKYNQQTFGIVDNIHLIKGIKDSQVGGKIYTSGYTINYHYSYDGEIFDTEEYIPAISLDIEHKIHFDFIQEGDSLLIKFNDNNPRRSMISTQKNSP